MAKSEKKTCFDTGKIGFFHREKEGGEKKKIKKN